MPIRLGLGSFTSSVLAPALSLKVGVAILDFRTDVRFRDAGQNCKKRPGP